MFRYYYESPVSEAPPAATYDEDVVAMLGASLLGYWACDEANGTLTDGTGNGWTMTLAAGSPTYQVSGPTIASVAQSAVQTDGAAYYTTSSSFTQASAVNGISVFAWVYLPGTTSAGAYFVARQASGTDVIAILRHASDGTGQMNYYTTGGTLIGAATQTDLDGDAWHLMVGWWDPADQDVRLSVDDAAAASAVGAANIDESVAAGWSLFATASGGSLLRSGSRLSKVGIVDGLLTAGQRTSLYTGSF